MVIKPPGNFGRAGIFEIDDGIFVAVKIGFVKKRAGAVQQARVNKFDVIANALGVKTRKKRSRRCAVKTPIVVKDLNLQALPFFTWPQPKVNRNDIWEGYVSSYVRVPSAKSLRISTGCELLSQWAYHRQFVMMSLGSLHE
jgi:hypothetical protein